MSNGLKRPMSPSLAGRALFQIALRVAIVIATMTAITYYHVVTTIKEQSLSQLENYIVERTHRERGLFKLAEDNHQVLKKELLYRLKAFGNRDPVKAFDRKVKKFQDGTYRTRMEGFDGTRESFVFIGRQVNIDADVRRKVVTFIDLGNEYGAAWHHRLQNVYFTAPENLLTGYWPEVPDWAHSLPADMYLPDEEYVWVADKQHNPSRESTWTGLFYDIGSQVWMISIETPVDIGERQVATIGHDITLTELLERTINDRLKGAYNLIVRDDGRLIAHPEKMEVIKAGQGNFDVSASEDAHLKSIYQAIHNRLPWQTVIKNESFDEYLAVGLLEEPGWYFVTVYPNSLVTAPAFETAQYVLLVGMFSLLLELIIFYWVLKRSVTVPLSEFAEAVNQVSKGQLNVQLDGQRDDEIGYIGKTFNLMTHSLMQHDSQLQFGINMSAAMNRALSTYVTDQESVHSVFNQMLDDILRITDSEYGFIGEIHQTDKGPFLKTHAITDISWDEESSQVYSEYADNGLEFHNLDTLFGAAIREQVVVISNDPANDERSHGLPEGHPSLKAFLGVPLTVGDNMVGMVGVANRSQGYDQSLVDELSTLFHTCANVINAFRKHQEAKVVEEALVASEEKYRLINSRVPGIVYQFKIDAKGKRSLPYVSPRVENYIGLTAETVMDDVEAWFSIVHPDDVDGLELSIVESMKKMTVWEWEGRFIKDNNEVKWLHGVSTPVKLQDGSMLWDGVFIDVTEQRKVEQEIEQSRARFEAMFEAIPDAIVYAGPDRNISLVNSATIQMFGYKESELLGNQTRMLYASPDDFNQQDRKRFNPNSNAAQTPYEIVYRCKDGHEFKGETLVMPVKSSDGEILGYLGIIRDITERTHVDAILRSLAAGASSMHFESFLNDMLARLTDVYDCDFAFIGRIQPDRKHMQTLAVRVNGQSIDNFDYSLEGTPCLDVLNEKSDFIPDDALKRCIAEKMTDDMGIESYYGEPLVASDGSVIGILSVMDTKPLRMDEWTKPVLGVFATRVSLELERNTSIKELQHHREHLQELVEERTLDLSVARDEAERANVAKSEFLSRMSHELRTPMNAILGFGQMLELDVEGFSETQRGNVKEILEAGHHLMALINEVLDLAKVESGKLEIFMEKVEVDEVVQQCIALVQPQLESRHLQLINQLNSKSYSVQADLIRFKQVLLNLLSNAVKYNRDRGCITLKSEVTDKQMLRIFIEDTGDGLSDAEIDKLYTPFERLNAINNIEGTGIGLAITRHLVKAMGGVIGVKSELGKGSVFWVELKLLPEEKEELAS